MSEVLTKSNFEKVINDKSGKVLVDFWASWCGPCRMLSINLEEAEPELEKMGVKLFKVNVDEEMVLADRFNINLIPALLLFENGSLKARKEGYISTNDIINFCK